MTSHLSRDGFASQRPDWIRDKKVTMLMQFGFARQPQLPDVPLLTELVQGEQPKQIAALVSLPTAIGYSHWLAPEVPSDRIAALRQAYVSALKDPALLADARNLNLEVVPKTADQIRTLIGQSAATPASIRDKTAAILEWN